MMEEEKFNLQMPTYGDTYAIGDRSGNFVVWEDGHWDRTRDMQRVLATSLMRARPDKSYHAIHGRNMNLRILRISGITIHAKEVPVLPNKEEVIAKARTLGLTDDDLRVLMKGE